MSSFKHADTGVYFDYGDAGTDTILAPPAHGGRSVTYPHKVYLNNEVHGQGWRHALVKRGVAYVVVDERETEVKRGVAYVVVDERETDGVSWNVIERWNISSHVEG